MNQLAQITNQAIDQWPSLIFPLIGTALGGLLAIVGGLVGERLRFKTEMRIRRQQAEWEAMERRRERRETTYGEMAVVANQVVNASVTALIDFESGLYEQASKGLQDLRTRIRLVYGHAFLFSAVDVRSSFDDVREALKALEAEIYKAERATTAKCRD